MSATSIDPDDYVSGARFNSDVTDTINGLVAHYRRELERYAEEMIENGMPTSIICKDLRTYRRDIECSPASILSGLALRSLSRHSAH